MGLGRYYVGLVGLLLFDLAVVGRRPHEPSMRESTLWVVFYVSLAVLFGLGILVTSGGEYAGEFFAGWVTEYSLSVDNLFVFVLIMANFAVPRIYQQKVLLVGIVIALVMRGAFIAAGTALIAKFTCVFYLFGLFLIFAAVKLAKGGDPITWAPHIPIWLSLMIIIGTLVITTVLSLVKSAGDKKRAVSQGTSAPR